MDLGTIWREFLQAWPSGLTQSGVMVMSGGEQIAFCSFLLSDQVVMLERNAPDTVGARMLVVPYAKIDAIKITEPVGSDVFREAGFREVRSGSQPSMI